MIYLYLLLGFFMLIKGASVFVDNASSLSKKIGIPSIIVGLTIVSIGTSAPELAVSIISSLNGSNDMSVGNVLGSNIFNLFAVLGGTALVSTIAIKKSEVKRDVFVNIFSVALMTALTYVISFSGASNSLDRFDGFILLALCALYIVILILHARKEPVNDDFDKSTVKTIPCIFWMVMGVALVVLGGNLVVQSATEIALSFGMSEKLVGLTIVSIGTSLPELVTSLVAALKGENDIALGNVLGSSIFNIFLILGASALISPITVAPILLVEMIILLFASLVLAGIIFLNKKEVVSFGKIYGALFVLSYISYVVYIIIRN